EPVFNFQVAGLHTYFVRNGAGNADVLVHNDSGSTTAEASKEAKAYVQGLIEQAIRATADSALRASDRNDAINEFTGAEIDSIYRQKLSATNFVKLWRKEAIGRAGQLVPAWVNEVDLDKLAKISAGHAAPSQHGVGQPGFWESLIPIWGSARAAIDD